MNMKVRAKKKKNMMKDLVLVAVIGAITVGTLFSFHYLSSSKRIESASTISQGMRGFRTRYFAR